MRKNLRNVKSLLAVMLAGFMLVGCGSNAKSAAEALSEVDARTAIIFDVLSKKNLNDHQTQALEK